MNAFYVPPEYVFAERVYTFYMRMRVYVMRIVLVYACVEEDKYRSKIATSHLVF